MRRWHRCLKLLSKIHEVRFEAGAFQFDDKTAVTQLFNGFFLSVAIVVLGLSTFLLLAGLVR